MTNDEWYERERAAFIAWWESDGQEKFGATPTLAAGAGWLAKAEAVRPEGVAIMPELSTVEIQEAICDHMLGLEWRESSGRHKSRCRSDAADVYNAIRAYCLPQ